jgi:hypothetical protein
VNPDRASFFQVSRQSRAEKLTIETLFEEKVVALDVKEIKMDPHMTLRGRHHYVNIIRQWQKLSDAGFSEAMKLSTDPNWWNAANGR